MTVKFIVLLVAMFLFIEISVYLVYILLFKKRKNPAAGKTIRYWMECIEEEQNFKKEIK